MRTRGSEMSPLEIHFQRVYAAGETIDGIDDATVVDKNIVELDGARARHCRGTWHEIRDFLRLVRIGEIIRAQTAVEERAENDGVGTVGSRNRQVFVQVVGTEATSAL